MNKPFAVGCVVSAAYVVLSGFSISAIGWVPMILLGSVFLPMLVSH